MAFKILTKDNVKDFKNFTYSEIKCKCGGKYCDGYPTGFSYDLMKNLQTIRNHFGKPIIITSGLRCEKHNENVGGTKNSRHKLGKAVDFYVKGVSYSKVQAYAKKLPYFHYGYNISGSVMHYDINPPEIVKKYNLTRLLKKGKVGDDVGELQKTLKIKADKIYGDQTKKSVVKFQKSKKLYTDGKVGKNTAHVLGWLWKGK